MFGDLATELEDRAWFITLEIDLYTFGILYQRDGIPGSKYKAPSGARVLANQALRGLRSFSDEFHSVRGNAKIVKGTSPQNEPRPNF